MSVYSFRPSGRALPKIAMKVKRDYLHPQAPAAGMPLLARMADQVENSESYCNHLLGLVYSFPGLATGYYKPQH